MSEFIQGAYNKEEHNHVEWSDERLQNRLNELHENNRLVGYTGDRLAQITKEMGLIAFEMAERLREEKNQQIEEAWGEHDEDPKRWLEEYDKKHTRIIP